MNFVISDLKKNTSIFLRKKRKSIKVVYLPAGFL